MKAAEHGRRIIRKGRQYLWGRKYGKLVWTPSTYEAWWDEEHDGANIPMVAKEVGGDIWTFNPITGEIREMTIERTAEELHRLVNDWKKSAAEQTTEAPLIELGAETAQAIHDAAYMLDSMKIMLGMFKDTPAGGMEAKT